MLIRKMMQEYSDRDCDMCVFEKFEKISYKYGSYPVMRLFDSANFWHDKLFNCVMNEWLEFIEWERASGIDCFNIEVGCRSSIVFKIYKQQNFFVFNIFSFFFIQILLCKQTKKIYLIEEKKKCNSDLKWRKKSK